MSNFFFFFYLSFLFDKIHKHSQACLEKKKKRSPFFATPSLAAVLVHPHTLASLSSLFFFIEKGKDIAREKEREEKEKWSYRFELHTVSILPSLNDLNKEFNTAGSE